MSGGQDGTRHVAEGAPSFNAAVPIPPKGSDIYIPSTVPIAYGSRLASMPAPFLTPDDPAAALALVATLDGQADLHLSEGWGGRADRLAHLALDVCCRALGIRA